MNQEIRHDADQIESSQLLAGYFECFWYARYMAFFEVYCDETGTGDDLPSVIIGGAVAGAKVWQYHVDQWDKVLREKQVKTYHATDCKTGYSEEYKHLSWPERYDMHCRLARLIGGMPRLWIFGIAVEKADFYAEAKKYPKLKLKPEQFATIAIFKKMSDWGESLMAQGEERPSLAVTFAAGSRIGTPEMNATLDFIKRHHDLEFFKGVKVVTTGTAYPVDVVPLQTADHVAHGSRVSAGEPDWNIPNMWRDSFYPMHAKYNDTGGIGTMNEKMIGWWCEMMSDFSSILRPKR